MEKFEAVDVIVITLVVMKAWVRHENTGCREACVQFIWSAGCCVLCDRYDELILLSWSMLCWVVWGVFVVVNEFGMRQVGVGCGIACVLGCVMIQSTLTESCGERVELVPTT